MAKIRPKTGHFCVLSGSIQAANYDEEELKKEAQSFDTLRPGEDMAGLEQAFAAAGEYRPGEGSKKK